MTLLHTSHQLDAMGMFTPSQKVADNNKNSNTKVGQEGKDGPDPWVTPRLAQSRPAEGPGTQPGDCCSLGLRPGQAGQRAEEQDSLGCSACPGLQAAGDRSTTTWLQGLGKDQKEGSHTLAASSVQAGTASLQPLTLRLTSTRGSPGNRSTLGPGLPVFLIFFACLKTLSWDWI